MTDRERLIEIIEKARAEAVSTIGSMNNGFAVWYADKLIEAGVAPVVHGEWEYYTHTMMACSICKRHVPRHKSEYCPHCGAKMDGGKNAEENSI